MNKKRANLNEVYIKETGGENLCEGCHLKKYHPVCNRIAATFIKNLDKGICKVNGKPVIIILQKWKPAAQEKDLNNRTVRIIGSGEVGEVIFVFNNKEKAVVRLQAGYEKAHRGYEKAHRVQSLEVLI